MQFKIRHHSPSTPDHYQSGASRQTVRPARAKVAQKPSVQKRLGQGEWVQAEVSCDHEGGAICIKVDLNGAHYMVLPPGLPALSVARKYWSWKHENGHPFSSKGWKNWTTSEPTDPLKLFIRQVRYIDDPGRKPFGVCQMSLVRKHRFWRPSKELSSFFRSGGQNRTALACNAAGQPIPKTPRRPPVVHRRRPWI